MFKEFLLVLSFFTRFPINFILGKRNLSGVSLGGSVWAFPLVGAIIGLCAGTIYIASLYLGFSPTISAWLAVFAQIILTGGLHEDGLADTADGLASGRTIAKKLEIMKDSQIGSYGVLALIIALSLKANTISIFPSNLQTLLFFMISAACSRACIVVLMRALPPAKSDGLAKSAGRPSRERTLASLLFALCSLLFIGNFLTVIFAILALTVLCFIIYSIAKNNFGGITGDILGATQQISEVLLLLIFIVL